MCPKFSRTSIFLFPRFAIKKPPWDEAASPLHKNTFRSQDDIWQPLSRVSGFARSFSFSMKQPKLHQLKTTTPAGKLLATCYSVKKQWGRGGFVESGLSCHQNQGDTPNVLLVQTEKPCAPNTCRLVNQWCPRAKKMSQEFFLFSLFVFIFLPCWKVY